MSRLFSRSGVRRMSVALLLASITSIFGAHDVRAEGVGQVLTSKSISAATVALIDPESGTSAGGSNTDVNVAVGDIILFQFNFSAVPDLRAAGLQGYLTEFIPANTQVVGVRLIDRNGMTIAPHLPGISQDACASACNAGSFDNLPCSAGTGCAGGQVDLTNGTIAQLHADTGVFFATDARMTREPDDQFITLANGINMTALGTEPTGAAGLAGLLGMGNNDPYYSHAFWDYVQMLGYGYKNNAYSGNGGSGNTPFRYGSPVAGPQTFYNFEATQTTADPATTTVRFNDVVGPWNRVRYIGSKIGSGVASNAATGPLTRMSVDVNSGNWGWDVTPNNALPNNAAALRYALGEVRVGEVRAAEVALRVLDTPLDPWHGGTGADVDCADVFGADVSGATVGSRADDNPWPLYVPSPNCVFLNLLFDLQVSKPVADGSDVLIYTLRTKNLSTNPQNNVNIAARYAGNEFTFGTASGGGAGASCPIGIGGAGNSCVVWPAIGTLAPGEERNYTFTMRVGGQGSGANVVFANYRSANLVSPGFTTQALTIVKPVAVVQARLAPATPSTTAGSNVTFTGVLSNSGNQTASMGEITFVLPTGWTLNATPTLSEGSLSCSTGCGTSRPTYTFSGASLDPEPQCRDGVDNADLEDALVDTLDPGCASPLDNDEGPGTSLVTEPRITVTAVVHVGNAATNGTYAVEMQTWHNQSGIGGDSETYFDRSTTSVSQCSDGIDNDGDQLFDYPNDLGCASPFDDNETATLSYVPDFGVIGVGLTRSARPVLDCPLGDNSDVVTGLLDPTTPLSATVKLYFNGVERASGGTSTQAFSVGGFAVLPACMDGINNDGDGQTDFPSDTGCASPWDDSETAGTTVDPSFGPLYGGLEVRASATGAGQLESPLSEPCFVVFVPSCSDGEDNDSDGLIDFPADPGCSSARDDDESDVECSDGINNDTDAQIDWPADLECTGPDDDSEAGPAACGDGVDNDADGVIDFPADPGCTSLADRSEIQFGACQDGVDNDGDSDIDFPADPGCHSANDDDETDYTSAAIRSRMLMVIDTSGSMNWNSCAETFTGGDGTSDCGGGDVSCMVCNRDGCGNGIADDSRLFKVKQGVSDVIAGFGDMEYAMMRFHQRATEFDCPTANASAKSGGWQGAGAAPCGGGFAGGDLLVNFAAENEYDMLEYLDGDTNYAGTTPPPGMDYELRGSGTTPLAGALSSALTELNSFRAADPVSSCRPYGVILLTDGEETCGGSPTTSAAALQAAGYDVHVIGFATSDPTTNANLDSIAQSGGTGSAVFVDNAAALAGALSEIVASTLLTETCNGVDDDCDVLIDEGYTLYCDPTSPTPLVRTLCVEPAEIACDGADDDCDGAVDEGLLNACGRCGTSPDICNGVDDDCDSRIDEFNGVPGGICNCDTEICNNMDDDCDGNVDEFVTRVCGNPIPECQQGTQTCTLGVWGACVGSIGPTAEVCDGLDNDCNGIVDGQTRVCGTNTGACQAGAELCTASVWGACIGAIGPTAEICDGIDNDCNGVVDNGVNTTDTRIGQACGTSTGECSTGLNVCTAGALVCSGAVGPVFDSCDALDNDCDTRIDEGNPGGGTACGTNTGECNAGAELCVAGSYVCQGSIGPVTDICDGLDNDCDTRTDENNPGGGGICGTNVGECTAGLRTCTAGALVCVGEVIGSAELCDGLDNDCDTRVDEGNPGGGQVCGVDTGECNAGTRLCVNGGYVCQGEIVAVAETCDNRDNDCDTRTDENNPGGGGACGISTGECAVGALACQSGVLACIGATGPATELCDALDNDCDGVLDEGNPGGGQVCGTNTGECTAGTRLCISGGYICQGEIPATVELCDDRDNDCDTRTDENNPEGGASCSSDIGECSSGTIQCITGGNLDCIGETIGSAEVCDLLDNDCDGIVDEGNPQGGATCGVATGECSVGVRACVRGVLACEGEVVSAPELCDNLDNDCDGRTDEGNPGGGLDCGIDTGECALGTTVCTNGAIVCPDDVEPATETCNNLDDDCDGTIDDGNPDGGGSCGMSDVGECELGSERCVLGALVCIGFVDPRPELCDNFDNDCDMAVDEGVSPSNGMPGTDPNVDRPCGEETGECTAGATICSGGSVVCTGGQGPIPEVCNGLDDDCDGDPDDGILINSPCGTDQGECQPGRQRCDIVTGAVVCEDEIGPEDETCDALDNDCDGNVDEGLGLMEACGSDVGECSPGRNQCVNGAVVCVNEAPPTQEACDCTDNDCDGSSDEVVPNQPLCPSGTACVDCQCARGCAESEFGFVCATGKAPVVIDGECYCVAARCDSPTCAQETITRDGAVVCAPDVSGVADCACRNNECGALCDGVVCGAGTICDPLSGRCREQSCIIFGCPADQRCNVVDGACEADPCVTAGCAADQVCRDGSCVGSCVDVTCADAERCVDGACVPDLCAAANCMGTEICIAATGLCMLDRCNGVACGSGFVCETVSGSCVADPCLVITCPSDQQCVSGECTRIATMPDGGAPPDGGPTDTDGGAGVGGTGGGGNGGSGGANSMDAGDDMFRRVFATGGGGCSCSVPSAGSPNGSRGLGGWLALAVCAVWLWRRRVRSNARMRATIQVVGLTLTIAAMVSGCDVEPFCIDCVEPGLARDSGNPDTGTGGFGASGGSGGSGGSLVVEAGVDAGTDAAVCLVEELCNGIDDTCDGVIDEGIDLQTDERHCGACDQRCAPAHALGECLQGTCNLAECDVGFVDLDMEQPVATGCEYRCLKRSDVDDVCDLRDDDCDGAVDDDVDLSVDPRNCGACGFVCRFAHAMAGSACSGGVCVLDDTKCDAGFHNADGNPANGCEYQCLVPLVNGVPAPDELCNLSDDDCDGRTDEGVDVTDLLVGVTCGGDVGECKTGVTECVVGAISCVGEIRADTEVCDGLDNDCDNTLDESDPQQGLPCGETIGTCDRGLLQCNTATLVLECAGGVLPVVELCDGLDNDCDTIIDNGNPEGGVACGQSDEGLCARGVTLCSNGTLGCDGDVDPVDDVCDGFDNDCDANIDENNPGGGGPCGINTGECNAGVRVCQGGALVCSGGDGPATELCDGLDNDCDGKFDEGNPGGGASCGTDTGTCQAGTERCISGAVVCQGAIYASTEVCDGLDNDCDGTPDDGNPGGGADCGSDVGACDSGTVQCQGGALSCIGAITAATEVCDAVDNDCDGIVDDGNPGGGSTCGISTGECSTGTNVCQGGVFVCTNAVNAVPEICDGLDNDCDGTADDGDPQGGSGCGTDVGQCVLGVRRCQGGSLVCTGATNATAEVCDGLDNDCDGRFDEGNPGGGGTCGIATGECSTGSLSCVAGSVVCVGSVGAVPEICDGLDNDCNGVNDNGNPGGGLACGTDVGQCAAGTTSCNAGAIVCVGATGTVPEACDGLDNDCDGRFDEGNPGGGASCGIATGECSPGSRQCLGGSLQCVGGNGAVPETCDTLDNDCDAAMDEGLLGTTANCAFCGNSCAIPNAFSVCSGTCQFLSCEAGWVNADNNLANGCELNCTVTGPELCDGVDNDCDADTDETFPVPPGYCGTDTGVCVAGTPTCSTGTLTCPGRIDPAAEACDGDDDDCDGTSDEDYGVGTACTVGQGTCRRTGTIACNGTSAAVCSGATPGTPGSESCNNLDDDCDGVVDDVDNPATPADEGIGLADMDSIDIGGGVRVMRYEASRADATSVTAGAASNVPCSRSGVMPWTNVTWPEAHDVCCALNAGGNCPANGGGFRLCDGNTWQSACSNLSACTWGYGTNCNTANGTTSSAQLCNGKEFDSNGALVGDQDRLFATGAFPQCRTAWSGQGSAFDMSGNVKEWVQTQAANGLFSIRGGSYSNLEAGRRCDFDFVVGDDVFAFENTGFRCCYYPAPVTECLTIDSEDTPITLAGTQGTISSTIDLLYGGRITDVNVVNVTGTTNRFSDLRFNLVGPSPSSTNVALVPAGSCGTSDNWSFSFDSAVATPLNCATNPVGQNGTFAPASTLNALNTQDSTGTWTLNVVDNVAGESATLTGWSLRVCVTR